MGQHGRLDRRHPMAAHSDPFGVGRTYRHPVTERARNGGSVRARCEGLRYGQEPFGAHY